ncbi:GumC domain-containing protein [Pleomorphovibrio marinus]|uniref:hypothetical protein n=1 Tax=Pleomorphovibrio marinus TaxID=2164132 RepID=UPI000E0B602E|nr:hypothetical protein [Pleomorphovibrio marinus]
MNKKDRTYAILAKLKRDKQISVSGLFTLVKVRLKGVFISFSIIMVLGMLIYFTTPKSFTSESKVLSEMGGMNQRMGGGMGSLLNLQNTLGGQMNNEQLDPELFPIIVMSEEFLLGLIDDKYQLDDKEISLIDYFRDFHEDAPITKLFGGKNFTPDSDTIAVGNFNEDFFTLTKNERIVIKNLQNLLEITKEGRVINVMATLQDPTLAAQLNRNVIKRLREFAANYQTDKQQQNLGFIESQTEKAKQRFENAQMTLARYLDANRGVNSQVVRSMEDKLRAENNLSFELYTNLSQQLEQAKIKLEEAKPVLTVFQRPIIPMVKSKPNLNFHIIFSILIGLITAFIYLVVYYFILYNKIQN